MFSDSLQTSHALMRTRRMCLCWQLINSLFGVFYSYFWVGDSCFPKNFFKFTLWTPTFSKRCLWDSYFQNPSENPAGYNIKKKKSFEIITASFNTAHNDWSGIRIIGANEFNTKSS